VGIIWHSSFGKKGHLNYIMLYICIL